MHEIAMEEENDGGAAEGKGRALDAESVARWLDELSPTRETLLSRLRDISEEGSWREFFELYWKLIYNTARKEGLSNSEAEDVVQETMIYLSQKLPEFKYTKKGSFKTWLMNLTYWKIADQRRMRERGKQERLEEAFGVEAPSPFEEMWNGEWEQNIFQVAFDRVRQTASPYRVQAYALCVLQKKGARTTARILRMSVPAVYLATHKVNKLIRTEIEKLKAEK